MMLVSQLHWTRAQGSKERVAKRRMQTLFCLSTTVERKRKRKRVEKCEYVYSFH